MFDNNNGFAAEEQYSSAASGAMAKTFMANVYAFMFAALAISGVTAYIIGSNTALFMDLFINEATMSPSILFWVVTLAPFAFILLMSFGFNKLSSPVLIILFMLFALVMGMSLSSVFMTYTTSSISTTFFITAGTFGVMSFLGYTTSTDLTKFGSILTMALIGLIVAILVNWFMQSEMMQYIISMAGVLIFTGFIAYDTQRLKRIGMGVEYGSATASKLAVMGALSLYLNFVNLFLFLLRILGSSE